VAWAQGVRNVDIYVVDPGQFVKEQLRGDLSGSSGVRMSLNFRDDGQAPDVTAQDGVYSARAPLSDHSIHIDFQSNTKRWSMDTTIPTTQGDTTLRLRLSPEQGVVVIQGDEPMMEGGEGFEGPAGGASWLWLVLFLGVGVGVGLGLTRLRHIGVRPADVDGDIPVPSVNPRRFDAHRLESVLSNLRERHHVVLLGDAGPGHRLVQVTSPRTTPEELVRRVEMLALESGGSVALVVGDPSRVEATGPLSEALDSVVRRRFALWLADGPQEWSDHEAAGTV
jgi:hypothetical protein